MSSQRTFDETKALIGANLRKTRKARGLTQEEAGELAGLSRSVMGYYEQGRRNPSIKTLHKLAVAYDVEISEFFQFDQYVPAYLEDDGLDEDDPPEEEPDEPTEDE